MFLQLKIKLIYVNIVGITKNLEILLIVDNLKVDFIKMICRPFIVLKYGVIPINF